MICAALGEGVLAVITGYLMDIFGINLLFYSILGINIFLLATLFLVTELLKEDSEQLEVKSKISIISIEKTEDVKSETL